MLPALPRLFPKVALVRDFDRSLFQTTFTTPALRVAANQCGRFLKEMSGMLLSAPRIKPIMPVPDSVDQVSEEAKKSLRMLLLKPGVRREDLPAGLLTEEEGSSACAWIEDFQLCLDYNYWTVDQIFDSALPDGLPNVSGFETIGHIAHLNLRDPHLPYREFIGQVILDKNCHNISTVVNKIDTIEHQFRFFKMEVLAGKDDLNAVVRENGCTFKFDFSRVYWNSKLHREHERLQLCFDRGDTVIDVMAGVGPFAVPAAAHRHVNLVLANDLNPSSHEFLVENIRRNNVGKYVTPYNLDGREMIRRGLAEARALKARRLADTGSVVASRPAVRLTQSTPFITRFGLDHKAPVVPSPRVVDHFVMNLPAIAIEFLDAFVGLYRAEYPELAEQLDQDPDMGSPATAAALAAIADQMPMIHVHCFEFIHDGEVAAAKAVAGRVGTVLGASMTLAPSSTLNLVVADRNWFLQEAPAGAAASATPPAPRGNAAKMPDHLAVPGSPGTDLPRPAVGTVHVHNVRSVAPNKDMYCASFVLPPAVALRQPAGPEVDAAAPVAGKRPHPDAESGEPASSKKHQADVVTKPE
ncbi:hypothetical protein H696_00474 [Fonticula alba]|uniref:tRNA (guanine(37)-N1)-methyltransferase n=1 Tax=Fonticula alba TaxID=691883 RepID=A0A058ZES0_FONAL|nr:hypothetical protein H696_00474 [Fonticula alba]KCV72905.1 hypothetical protein H696_00474 [Fonticula alba]|eukprot:XP_009492606.1 hypothetical protein H696_00474 [Fonticula alba]